MRDILALMEPDITFDRRFVERLLYAWRNSLAEAICIIVANDATAPRLVRVAHLVDALEGKLADTEDIPGWMSDDEVTRRETATIRAALESLEAEANTRVYEVTPMTPGRS